MNPLTCPRCHAPHDGVADKNGWATCRKCAFCWQLHPTNAAAEEPVGPAAAHWGDSDEYAPDDSVESQRRTKALARSGASPVLPDSEAAHKGRPPSLDQDPKIQRPSRPLPAAAPRQAAFPLKDQPVDSQLFERLEREAQSDRSQLETMAASSPAKPLPPPPSGRPLPPAPGPAVIAPVTPDPAAPSDKLSCPVCGHAFAAVGSPPASYQTCPQCSTTFNLTNGRLAANAISEQDGEDGKDWLLGRTIRGCFIDKKLGEGGMGAVYHARQLSLDRGVALKVMPAELARNRNFIQRFEREAKSLAKINHPNILHIYDFGEDHALGIYFMIIEFVDGKDLGEILRERHAISQIEALDLIRQAAMGLEMAAEKGVIHRDIKPDNLMISGNGICKVSDFGLAKGYGSLDEVTNAGVRVGTPAFMSPEQCDGKDVDFRSDVYSLGCTAFLALTGTLPFAGDSPFSIMLKHKTEPVPSLRVHNPDIDVRVDRLVRQMLAKDPKERCTTLRELVDLVEHLQISIAGTTSVFRRGGGDAPHHHGADVARRDLAEKAGSSARLVDDNPAKVSPFSGDSKLPDLPGAEPPLRLQPLEAGAAPVPAPAPAPPTPKPSARSVTPLGTRGDGGGERAKPSTSSRQHASGASGAQRIADQASHSGTPAAPAAEGGRRNSTSSRLRSSGVGKSGESRSGASSGLNRAPDQRGGEARTGGSTELLAAKGDAAIAKGSTNEAVDAFQAALRRRPGNRDLQAKLAEARKHQRHHDVEGIEARGDELAAVGRLDEAVGEWLRASQVSSTVTRREQLLAKVDAAQRRGRNRRRLRRIFGTLLLLGAAGANVWLWTPLAHNWYADRELAKIEQLSDPSAKRAALEQLIAELGHSFAWYPQVFRQDYVVKAAAKAQQQLSRFTQQVNDDQGKQQDERETHAIKVLEQLDQDQAATWQQVGERAKQMLPALTDAGRRAKTQTILDHALAQLKAMDADLAAIRNAIAHGKPGTALALAGEFRAKHTRGGDFANALPLPGRIEVRDPDLGKVMDAARIVVDGVALPTDEHQFCRHVDRETIIEVSAPGFLSERVVLPADSDLAEKPVTIALRPGASWQGQIPGGKPPWYGTSLRGDGTILVFGGRMLQAVRGEDGALLSDFKREAVNIPPAAPDPIWTMLQDPGDGHLIVGSSDGLVVRATWKPGIGPVFDQVLHRGSQQIAAYHERELIFQPGRRARVVVEMTPEGPQMAMFSNQEELWRFKELHARASVQLLAQDDRFYVIDDRDVHVLDESGKEQGGHSLAAPRNGRALTLEQGKLLIVPTADGIEALRLGGQPQVLKVMELPAELAAIGACQLSAQGNDLLLVHKGVIQLLRWHDGVPSVLWTANLPDGRSGGLPALSDQIALVVDEDGAIQLFARSDGKPRRRYLHGHQPAVPPLVFATQVLVLDQDARLTAYFLPNDG